MTAIKNSLFDNLATPDLEQPINKKVLEIQKTTSTDLEVYYSYDTPVFKFQNNNYLLEISNAFSKIDMEENVLNKQIVKQSCKKELQDSTIIIDLENTNGLLIRLVNEEDWMFANEAETKIMFEKKLLDVYRNITSNLKQNIEQPKVTVDKKSYQNDFPTNEEDLGVNEDIGQVRRGKLPSNFQ